MRRLVNKKLVGLVLVLASFPVVFLTCALAQRQAERPRRAKLAEARTITVKAGGNFQAALNRAVPGDQIVLETGATFTGNFVLPVKSGSEMITVRSLRSAELPAGQRVGPAKASLMAKVVTPNSGPAIRAPIRSKGWRLEGLEITQGPSVDRFSYALVELGESETQLRMEDVPTEFEIDRCIIRARDNHTAVQRGVTLNSANTKITNSHISGIKWAGVETQAVGGWNGPGPFLIENNYLEAAGVNVMFGGAPATVPGLIPSDITLRNNHVFKPLAWRQGDPAYQGTPWTVKNLLEFKTGRRVLVENNVFENSWPHAQSGWAMIANIGSDTGPGNVFEDVLIRRNIFRNVTNGINLRGMEDSDRATKLRRVTFSNNLIENLSAFDGEGKAFQLLQGTEDVTFDHNTITGRAVVALSLQSIGSFRHTGFTFTNNLIPYGLYGVFGDGGTIGSAALDRYCSRWAFAGNVITGADPARHPPRNFYPPTPNAKLYIDVARGNYRIADPKFKGRAIDHKDPGCDFSELETALSWYLRPAG